MLELFNFVVVLRLIYRANKKQSCLLCILIVLLISTTRYYHLFLLNHTFFNHISTFFLFLLISLVFFTCISTFFLYFTFFILRFFCWYHYFFQFSIFFNDQFSAFLYNDYTLYNVKIKDYHFIHYKKIYICVCIEYHYKIWIYYSC